MRIERNIAEEAGGLGYPVGGKTWPCGGAGHLHKDIGKQPSTRPLSISCRNLQRMDDLLDNLFRVSQQHHRLIHVEQFII